MAGKAQWAWDTLVPDKIVVVTEDGSLIGTFAFGEHEAAEACVKAHNEGLTTGLPSLKQDWRDS
jgi:hypothetical protein